MKDLPEIASLYKGFWGESSNLEQMQTRFELLKQDKRYCLLVAEHTCEVVGTIFGVVCDELYGNCLPFMVMEDLIVKESHMRTGVASLLMAQLEEFAKFMKCTQLQFITESNRTDAIRFYERIGYDSSKNVGFKKKL